MKTGANLFTHVSSRYCINGWSLIAYREKLKLSVEQFAEIAGWSSRYQYTLESSDETPLSISEQLKDEIIETFRRFGVDHIKTQIYLKQIFIEQKRYKINSKLLKQLIMTKTDRLTFAKKMNFTLRHSRRMVNGEIEIVSEAVAKRIQSILGINKIT